MKKWQYCVNLNQNPDVFETLQRVIENTYLYLLKTINMCTVSYIPQNKGFCLTYNRDTDESRPSSVAPVISKIGGVEVLYPSDPLIGGTWIATSAKGRTVCLLDGSFGEIRSLDLFNKTVSLAVHDSFAFDNFQEFANNYVFKKLPPFTMVVIELVPQISLMKFVWDGKSKTIYELDETKNEIWSSSSVYDDECIKLRESWFVDWAVKHSVSPESILSFHHKAGNGDPQKDLIVRKNNGICTESITQVLSSDSFSIMKYINVQTVELAEAVLQSEKSIVSESPIL